MNPTGEGLPHLVSICRWGSRFYCEAAEVSHSHQQTQALQHLELQRATLANELQGWVEPASWPESILIPQVREARRDEQILEMCDRIDAQTIAAYDLCINTLRPETARLRSVLERHLVMLWKGRERRSRLRGQDPCSTLVPQCGTPGTGAAPGG